MREDLSATELVRLVERVFALTPRDAGLALITDLPGGGMADRPAWRERREMVCRWTALLRRELAALGLPRVTLAWYPNVGSPNADLPEHCVPGEPTEVLHDGEELAGRPALRFADLFDTHTLLLAPTELSATAPVRLAAKAHALRAATLPGFTRAMLPALRLDFAAVAARVDAWKEKLDAAREARFRFAAAGEEHELRVDLRHREGHASAGRFHTPGSAGNLPPGEAFIVPYEGERPGEPSRTEGVLPVQLGEEVVLYRVHRNRAVEVLSDGPISRREASRLRAEPARGNLAELGIGVLAEFGLEPVGEILLDEKLGLHLAFGRSDHFGGTVGPRDFSRSEEVVHIDRVYLPSLQPRVEVLSFTLA